MMSKENLCLSKVIAEMGRELFLSFFKHISHCSITSNFCTVVSLSVCLCQSLKICPKIWVEASPWSGVPLFVGSLAYKY